MPIGVENQDNPPFSELLTDQVWMPLDLQRALHLERMPVIMYNDTLREQIFDICLGSQHIGLTHISLDTGRNVLICLTTSEEIIVLHMLCSSHIDLLVELLNWKVLKFYTLRGQYLAYKLLVEFGIEPPPMTDLTAYDVFLSMRSSCLNGTLAGRYTVTTLHESQGHVMYRNRRDLAQYWLGVSLPEKADKSVEKLETQMVKTRTESIEAENVIRERSCLTRALAIKMLERFDEMTFQDVNNLYSFAHKVSGEKYNEYENLSDNTYATAIDYLKRQGCDDSDA